MLDAAATTAKGSIMDTPMTKRNYPRVAEFAWHMVSGFDGTITYAKDGDSERGSPSDGEYVQPVIQQRKK